MGRWICSGKWTKWTCVIYLCWIEAQKIIKKNHSHVTHLLFAFGPPLLLNRLAWKQGVCACWATGGGGVSLLILTFRHWFGLNNKLISLFSLLTGFLVFPEASWFTRQLMSSGEPRSLLKIPIASSDWLPAIATVHTVLFSPTNLMVRGRPRSKATTSCPNLQNKTRAND